ncbi:MAG TPA: hypothetical protein VG652_03085 [Gaiellaceae bacterium]|nr:hypothetical protein [Gaiellaceae bacterium]
MKAALTVAAMVVFIAPGTAFAARFVVNPLGLLTQIHSAPSSGLPGPEGAPIPQAPPLAAGHSPALNKSVDGIKCQRSEQVLFHIHAHLTIFVNGQARLVPYGIGIAPPIRGDNTTAGPFVTSGSCFAWLHTHTNDGIIHIESPVQLTYTLGNFFDVWHQPLNSDQVGPARGKVTVFVNSELYVGNPRDIPLLPQAQIQLDVGLPVIAPESITFPQGL